MIAMQVSQRCHCRSNMTLAATVTRCLIMRRIQVNIIIRLLDPRAHIISNQPKRHLKATQWDPGHTGDHLLPLGSRRRAATSLDRRGKRGGSMRLSCCPPDPLSNIFPMATLRTSILLPLDLPRGGRRG